MARLGSSSVVVSVLVAAIAALVLAQDRSSAPASKPAGSQPATSSAPASQKELTLDLGDKVTMKLALIPAGKFMMGSPEKEKYRRQDEGPQHEVTISKPFYMGKNLVTQEQYKKVMGANPSNFRKDAQNPVEVVSWDEAQEFCKKLSTMSGKAIRLPTEAQWEYACRAGSTTAFFFGDDQKDLPDYAWFGSKPVVEGSLPPNSDNVSHPVGQKKPNAWGLYDMNGNVFEWCQDWYGSYPSDAVTDPQGADKGTDRVVRGAAWYDNSGSCRSAYRNRYIPTRRGGNVGFRVVAEASLTAP